MNEQTLDKIADILEAFGQRIVALEEGLQDLRATVARIGESSTWNQVAALDLTALQAQVDVGQDRVAAIKQALGHDLAKIIMRRPDQH